MDNLVILCVDDEREVLDSVMYDLAPFAADFELEAAESVDEARELVQQLRQEGSKLALILCDHIMPGMNGIDYLIELEHDGATRSVKKVLLTGQAGFDATIEAINKGGLDCFIGKPWKPEQLQSECRRLLTDYVIHHCAGPELLSYSHSLDGQALYAALEARRLEL